MEQKAEHSRNSIVKDFFVIVAIMVSDKPTQNLLLTLRPIFKRHNNRDGEVPRSRRRT